MAKYRALKNVTLESQLFVAGEVYEEDQLDPALDIEGDFEPASDSEASAIDEEVEDNGDGEEVDISSLKRAELDAYAVEHTNLDPKDYAKIGDLREAIEEELA